MKKYIWFFYLFLIPAPGQCQAQHDDFSDVLHVSPNPEMQLQTIEGWGSSLCWWAGQAGNWEEAKVDSIVDLITSPDKLNMNIFRYNIGGGDDPAHINGHMVQGKGKRAEMEGFKASSVAPYNWNADKAQRTIMLKIKEKRPDAVFEAFSNSPPYWMTYSGCSAGNADPEKDNLRPEYYDAFCEYLTEVCKHYKDEYGIEFKTLEPFNESTSAYWNYKGSQEGCHFDIGTQKKIIRLLYSKLKASGLTTVISASDETNLSSFIKVLKAYKEADDIMDKVGQLNTHTYSGTNEERLKVHRLVMETGKDFWQSETGPMGLPRRANGLESNLLLVQKMFYDLNLMQPQAWLDWQLMEETNDTWCVIRCNFNSGDFEIVKNYYVRMQITKFIKQGYMLLESNCDDAVVAVSPQKTELVIALNNPNKTSRDFKVNLGSFLKTGESAQIYRTSSNENCNLLNDIQIQHNQISYPAPELSLTTFVILLNP